jgi:hypothetical protein
MQVIFCCFSCRSQSFFLSSEVNCIADWQFVLSGRAVIPSVLFVTLGSCLFDSLFHRADLLLYFQYKSIMIYFTTTRHPVYVIASLVLEPKQSHSTVILANAGSIWIIAYESIGLPL